MASKSGAASLEYRTLVACTQDLELALGSDRDLVHELHQGGFVKDDYDNIIDPKSSLSAKQKAGYLVVGIKNKVFVRRESYLDFISILEKQPNHFYDDIIETLQQCCKSGTANGQEISFPTTGPFNVLSDYQSSS